MKVSHNKNITDDDLKEAVKELMYIINESKSQLLYAACMKYLSCERTNVHHK